jgi:hypothetical protein
MSSNPTLAWLDSTGRFQRELDAVSNEIVEQRTKVDALSIELKAFQQELTDVATQKGWFRRGRADYDIEYDISKVELKLEQEQTFLNELEADYRELTSNLFPQVKTWTFDEADLFIFDLLEQIKAEAARGGYIAPGMSNEKISIPVWDPNGKDPLVINPADFAPLKGLAQMFGNFVKQLSDDKQRQLSGIKIYRLILYINHLYSERRNLLPAYLPQLAGWDNVKLSSELNKRQQELKDSEVELNKLEGLAISEISVQNPFVEQRRFLQQLIDQVQMALRRSFLPPTPPTNPRTAKIAALAALQQEWDDARKNNRPELHPDIDRMYSQLMDDERRKP